MIIVSIHITHTNPYILLHVSSAVSGMLSTQKATPTKIITNDMKMIENNNKMHCLINTYRREKVSIVV